MSRLIKLPMFILVSICFFLINSPTSAQDKYSVKETRYSHDPYYEEGAPNKVKTYGNYQIRDRAIDAPFTIEAYEKIMSSYVWRNVTRNDEPTSETGFSLLASKITFSLTAFMDLSDYGVAAGYGDQSFEFTELDISLSYDDKWGDFMYQASIVHYLFPNKFTPLFSKGRLTNDSTTEINFLVGYDIFLKPSLLLSFDIDESQGIYLELGASHSITKKFWNFPTRINMGGGLGIGSADFNEYHFGVDSFTSTGLTLRTNWEWMLKPNMILTPELGVSFPFDSKITDAMDAADNIQSSSMTVYFSLKFVFTM